MTARGKQVKLQNLSLEREIFLYDRRILVSSSNSISSLLPKRGLPAPFSPDAITDSSTNVGTLQAWQILYKRRRAWAIELADGSRPLVDGIRNLDREIRVIRRGVAIAVDNIRQHVGNLQPKYNESKTWADQVCEDQAFLLDNWQKAINVLGSIPAYQDLSQCLHGVHTGKKKQSLRTPSNSQITLQDLLDLDEVGKAAEVGKDVSQRFAVRLRDLRATFEGIVSESGKIIEGFQQSTSLLDIDAGAQGDRLIEEIEVLAKKINADYENILGLPDTPKSVSQASKTAQIHKTNFLPSLIQTNDEINQLLAQTIERKEQAVRSSVRYLQEISVIESTVSTVHSRLASLDSDNGQGQVFDVLDFAIKLPSLYGSLLVECVRRQEWAEKMTTDSSSLVEEMATYKEEEAKRRKRWLKDMGGTIDLQSLDDMALDIEVNVHAQRQKWAKITRDDIADFMQRLGELEDLDGALKEVSENLKTLDAPSKQQARRAKAFKNGSIHEANYGKTSLLLRGDDELLHTMRNEKIKVEDKLKSAESRVRKLEDLLHRQSQFGPFSRPTSAAGLPVPTGPVFERHVTSPLPNFSSALSKARETGSRRSSVSSRRLSMNNESEEKGLAQRIVSLEAELSGEKLRSADLAKKTAARSNAEDLLKSQVREAISTKEDLLGNLEAQQREFDDERRLLHEEYQKLKLENEQLEDELESRSHDDRTRILEDELEQVKRDATSEIEGVLRQKASLKNDYEKQCNQTKESELALQQQSEGNAELTRKIDQLSVQLDARDKAQMDHHKALQVTLGHLSHEGKAPEGFNTLVATVTAVVEKSAAHLEDVESALETLRAENKAFDARLKTQDDEIYDLRERLGSEEREVFAVREKLGLSQTELSELRTQLESQGEKYDHIKADFKNGQTNLNTLQTLLAERESSVTEMASKLAQHQNDSQRLESQTAQQEASLETLRESHARVNAARKFQTSRAVEMSNRMLSQNTTMERLLEQIGLMITREDNKMNIQKAPRAANASTILADPSMSMKRSLSGPLPTNTDSDPSSGTELPCWTDTDDLEEVEKQFGRFWREATSFDLDIFSEAVHKRVKEIEHIARKWQKEARAYRDKSHRAQGEAHDRIALRNFKEGDLALFLPTRDQATKPWAAFNVGAPHCFLREQDSHNLSKRDWLIARISKVEERVVDLSKSINGGLKGSGDQRSGGDKSNAGAFPNDENPYELSDGLRWYLIDAAEEKPGAPISVGTGKVTVASAHVDAKGSIRMKKSPDGIGATKTLTRSLDSRRSSTNSKKGLVAVSSNSIAPPTGGLDGMIEQSIDNAAAAAAASSNMDVPQARETERPRSSQTLDIPASSGQDIEHVGRINAPDW